MRCPHCSREMAYPSTRGPYFEPKIGGELIHEACPHCEKFLDTVAILPTDITVRLIITMADQPEQRRAA